MKPQDLAFIIVFLFLLFKRKPEWFVYAGIFCLILAVPLFSAWIFFTAQRLTYYAAGFFLAAIVIYLAQARRL